MKLSEECFKKVKKDCFKFIKSQETSTEKFGNKEGMIKSFLIPICFWIAKKADNKEAVEKFYEIAISKGATDEGGPGARSDGNYYAYIRDFDGNKIAAKSNLK